MNETTLSIAYDDVCKQRDYFARKCVDLEDEVANLTARLVRALAVRGDSPLVEVSAEQFSMLVGAEPVQ